LEVRDLRVYRDGFALEVPEFSMPGGEILALLGPNGSGKSTLLMALCGLLELSRGEILFDGRKMETRGARLEHRRRVTMVFQEPLLLRGTVSDNVATGLRIRGKSRGEVRERVMRNLARFRIPHLERRSVGTLSGGEAQRTSLARAFAIQPEILLLDEPFSSLDPPTRESLMEDLKLALRETGTTTLFATHDRLEALQLSDRLAVMGGGRILQMGPAEEVMNRPVDDFVAAFVSVEKVRELLDARLVKAPRMDSSSVPDRQPIALRRKP
jgi:tungstate transport system ATP-binding protein